MIAATTPVERGDDALGAAVPHFAWILHFVFWWPFLLRGQLQRSRGQGAHLGEPVKKHPHAVQLVAAHTVAVAPLYAGMAIEDMKLGGAFPPNLVLGTALILAGSLTARWTLRIFTSWRLRAEVTADHQLTTIGPFRVVRHPIYLAMNLLAAGTVAWFPTPLTITGLLLTILVGDLRARAEEQLLTEVFGDAYRAYSARVKRTIPFLY
jgi:protein-S-isoprenylcysteine O-methyltransferase Ste14